MARKIFVNLPVKDLAASMAFFKALGFANNAQFTDETAACMVVSDDIYVMLLTHAKFTQFSPLPVADATRATEVLTCLSCDSRSAVDEVVDKGLAAGGTSFRDPQDYGFMYGRSFQDLDGHIWEWFWMDPAAVKPA